MSDLPSPGGGAGRPKIRFGQPSVAEGPPPFGAGGVVAGVVLIVVVLGGLLWSAGSGRPAAAVRPSLFGGSLVLEDSRPLTVINVATAQITVRLQGVNAQVGADSYGSVQPVPVSDGTVLVNTSTGAFNFLEPDDYVTDPAGPGVGLGPLRGATGAEGLPSGADAYILRSAPASTVSLVARSTVAAASRASGSTVPPLGFASLPGTVDLRPGSAVVNGSELWTLVSTGRSCRLEQSGPSPTGGGRLNVTSRMSLPGGCATATVESAGGTTALAAAGRISLFRSGNRPTTVEIPGTGGATRIVPVSGSDSVAWFLASLPGGWALIGADPAGRPIGPFHLADFAANADPAPPVLSHGFLYTLDQKEAPQPNLWSIDPQNGHMAPVAGAATYPLRNSSEEDNFEGAEVLVDGPRVVFNNPQSLEAVVVFTDGSHRPVIVDKSAAVAISTTGPADLEAGPAATTPPAGGAKGGTPASGNPAVPVAQPVSQKVTCANTTQKPYAPQVTAITPSSDTALIAWSYELLDQTDCEPSSWAVQVTALSGSHQPARSLQVVYGQNQYLFTGLRPATRYSVVVTAFINTQSTPSAATTFTTAARGPDAPLSVSTSSDGQGDWVVSWTPCTETANPSCVVPSDQWTVIGSACGTSYVGTPPSVQVAGTSSSVTINADNLGLLGQSLSFTVQGSLVSGLTGDPKSDGGCTQAWRKPDPSTISLTGSGAAAGSTVTATLQVSATGNAVEDFGTEPSETEFVYSVGGRTIGPTTNLQALVPGLPAGQQFAPSVQIYPAGHPEAAVTVTGAPFSQTLPWPSDLQGGMTVTPAVGGDPNTGTITVSFPADLPPGPLTANGVQITCGSTAVPEPDGPLSGGRLTYPMDLVDTGGDCGVSLTLNDDENPDPYGVPSPRLTAAFEIGTQPNYAFSASVSSSCQLNFICGIGGQPFQIQVASTTPGPVKAGGDWTVSTPGPLCGSDQNLPGPDFPYTFQLPATCPDAASVDVNVSFKYLGQVVTVDAGTPGGSGSPPTTATTTPASSTTSTSVPKCPAPSTTTTARSATTSTTAHGGTTTTPPACTTSAASGSGPSGTALAAAAAGAAGPWADPVTRAAIGAAFAAAAAAWLFSAARRIRSRRTSEKGRR